MKQTTGAREQMSAVVADDAAVATLPSKRERPFRQVTVVLGVDAIKRVLGQVIVPWKDAVAIDA